MGSDWSKWNQEHFYKMGRKTSTRSYIQERAGVAGADLQESRRDGMERMYKYVQGGGWGGGLTVGEMMDTTSKVTNHRLQARMERRYGRCVKTEESMLESSNRREE